MPKIDLCFSGWIRGVEVKKATNDEGKAVNVSNMPAAELTQKLNDDELFVSLGDLLYKGDKEEVELFDFQPSGK